MANKRILKKDINYLTYDLLAECFTYQYFHPELDQKMFDEVASSIINNRNDLISRINHIDSKEGSKKIKEQFNAIRKDFEQSVEALDKLEKKSAKK
jgi:hypothetical protein